MAAATVENTENLKFVLHPPHGTGLASSDYQYFQTIQRCIMWALIYRQ
jgi:hypothetical protein